MATKKTVLQGTGFCPVGIEYEKAYTNITVINKRSVTLSVYREKSQCWYRLALDSSIRGEPGFVRAGGPFEKEINSCDLMLESIKTDAKRLLPPGVGFPDDIKHIAQRAKLKGQLLMAALTSLDRITMAIYEDDNPELPLDPA